MLPVVAGRAETRRQIVIYSVLLAPSAWHRGGSVSRTVLRQCRRVLGGVFLLGAMRVWRDDQERHCRQLFGFSILYLFAIFAMLLVDRGIAVL